MGQPVNKELFFLLACGCGCVWLASPGLAVILGAVLVFLESFYVAPCTADSVAGSVAVVGGLLRRALWFYGRWPVGGCLCRRCRPLAMPGARHAGAVDSLAGAGLGGAGGR